MNKACTSSGSKKKSMPGDGTALNQELACGAEIALVTVSDSLRRNEKLRISIFSDKECSWEGGLSTRSLKEIWSPDYRDSFR